MILKKFICVVTWDCGNEGHTADCPAGMLCLGLMRKRILTPHHVAAQQVTFIVRQAFEITPGTHDRGMTA